MKMLIMSKMTLDMKINDRTKAHAQKFLVRLEPSSFRFPTYNNLSSTVIEAMNKKGYYYDRNRSHIFSTHCCLCFTSKQVDLVKGEYVLKKIPIAEMNQIINMVEMFLYQPPTNG